MEVQNCRTCGRLFNYLSGPQICPACKEEMEKKFQDVKEYVRENPHATISEISEVNGVSTNQIRQWVREERLQFADDSPVGIECEVCGVTIRTGRFCEGCKNKMASNLSDSIRKPVQEQPQSSRGDNKNRMRFI